MAMEGLEEGKVHSEEEIARDEAVSPWFKTLLSDDHSRRIGRFAAIWPWMFHLRKSWYIQHNAHDTHI